MENKVTLEITPLSPLEVIIDFNDPIIRKALIDFGWTPPKETPKGICKYCGTNIKDCIGLCPKCYNKISEEDK